MKFKRGLAVLMALLLINPADALIASATEPLTVEAPFEVLTLDPEEVSESNTVNVENVTDAATTEESVEDEAVAEESVDAAATDADVATAEVSDDAAVEASVDEESLLASEDEAADAASDASSDEAATESSLGLKVADLLSGVSLFDFDEMPEFDDVVYYNTGSQEYEILPAEAKDYDPYCETFDENGEYTIEIPEGNPFFPYEVQFRVGDNTWTEWFVTPDSKVEVAGHTIGVNVWDGRYSNLTLHVGDEDIVVYPKEKTFTNAAFLLMSKAAMSYQQLEEIELGSISITGKTPLELSRTQVSAVFNGTDVSSSSIVCNLRDAGDDDQYTISAPGSALDLSRWTTSSYNQWEFIVGTADQLDQSNKRYIVNIEVTDSDHWLDATVKTKDADGKVSDMAISYEYYSDYNRNSRELYLSVNSEEYNYKNELSVSLAINSSYSFNDTVTVYEGTYTTPEEAASGKDITAEIWNGSGYSVKRYENNYITIVSRNSAGTVTGFLPLYVYVSASTAYSETTGVIRVNELNDSQDKVNSGSSWSTSDPSKVSVSLYRGYAANAKYNARLYFEVYAKGSSSSTYNNEKVVAAYVGDFESNDAAKQAGAKDIKDQLFSSSSKSGYAADYSNGVTFTIFADLNGDGKITRHPFKLTTYEGTTEKGGSSSIPSSSTAVRFTGLIAEGGERITDLYIVDPEMDSYADYSYRTIIVGENVDLTKKIAPEFSLGTGVSLYATGSATKIESGKDFRDFNGVVQQYTAASEDGNYQENFWLQVIKAKDNSTETSPKYNLYINSLGDKDAEVTVDEKGVTRANREMLLDYRSDYKHDILVINMGNNAIENVKASLESDTLAIDEYWTLSGDHKLSGYVATSTPEQYDELPNLAKIRIAAKKGVKDGTEVSGTLTITSNDDTIAVIKLTGTVGNPTIITNEVPEAVKYVHYGTMIQNSNKYSWNKVSYSLSGKLPAGLELRPNGEIYGVPQETGEFTFTVRMNNSYSGFGSVSKQFTLKVVANTDANVDNATSENYDVMDRIPDFTSTPSQDATFRSKGDYSEFTRTESNKELVAVTLDGQALTPDKDYTSESGSTRITIKAQTLARGNGAHTLSVEFRDEKDTFHRAAQNYHISGSYDNGGSSDSNSGSSDSSSSGSSSSASNSSSSSAAPAKKSALTVKTVSGKTTGVKGEVMVLNATVTEQVQGPQAMVAFQLGTPAGFTQATTLNIAVNGAGINYDKKAGRLSFAIRDDLQKAGRTFALVGLDKTGVPHLFTDVDADNKTITVDIDLEGYAFALIYTDNAVAAQNALTKTATATAATGTYTVQSGDTLSRIARKLITTVAELVRKNNISDPNKIFPGQTLNY